MQWGEKGACNVFQRQGHVYDAQSSNVLLRSYGPGQSLSLIGAQKEPHVQIQVQVQVQVQTCKRPISYKVYKSMRKNM